MDTDKKKKKKSLSARDLPDVSNVLPQHLEKQKTRIFCASDAPTYVSWYCVRTSLDRAFC
jgi:hypothetical protein